MLEQRVANLERDMGETKASVRSIHETLIEITAELKHLPRASDYASLKDDVAEIKGRLANTPTALQFLAMIISTWTTGAAIVFAIIRFGAK